MTDKKATRGNRKPAHPQLPKMDTHRGGLGKGLSALIPTAPPGPRLGDSAADIILGASPRTTSSRGTTSRSSKAPAAPDLSTGTDGARGGLRALGVGAAESPAANEFGATYQEIPLTGIRTNPKNPRQVFEEEALDELVHSIREFGLLQPIVVRPLPADEPVPFELIMGERRFRATELAGLEVIPAIVRETEDADMLRDALLENIHRVQLNPLEEASAYQQLLEEFDVSQAELARRIGRSRPLITNMIRLLQLPLPVQRKVAAGVLSAGHARAILGVKAGAAAQENLADRIIAEGLSVRATEEAVVLLNRGDGERPTRTPRTPREQPEVVREWANSAADALDTRVTVQMGAKKGKIVVEFGDAEDFERITDLLKLPRE
ncbi:ParB/RepB/Spo0J family partition protein [Corynebacterium terpenotabidum]|uniref:Chromosome partitioning protein n=1 Tax=Corynebacterium terpenotabidum Y-11 TaxID=1200352 RepID=S4XHL9_9CORY|nr:ParB/RepB/Spo0J family partition protein [Corynebacterium terpenotabidum]AGP32021.1 chromosome partitioning protein [Corynebacterium terpenotabidum Y-11]